MELVLGFCLPTSLEVIASSSQVPRLRQSASPLSPQARWRTLATRWRAILTNRQQKFSVESRMLVISPLSHRQLLQSVGPSDYWGTLANLQCYNSAYSSQHPTSPSP